MTYFLRRVFYIICLLIFIGCSNISKIEKMHSDLPNSSVAILKLSDFMMGTFPAKIDGIEVHAKMVELSAGKHIVELGFHRGKSKDLVYFSPLEVNFLAGEKYYIKYQAARKNEWALFPKYRYFPRIYKKRGAGGRQIAGYITGYAVPVPNYWIKVRTKKNIPGTLNLSQAHWAKGLEL